MAKHLSNFTKMWNIYPYPKGSSERVKSLIGGKVDADWIKNTCAIRISRCFNYSGFPVPSNFDGLSSISGDDGLRYAYRVRELTKYLRGTYGKPHFTHRYDDPSDGTIPPSFKGAQGIISFKVSGWTDATGHFDLWDGQHCIHTSYFHKASAVYLWLVTDEPANDVGFINSNLSASVGRHGINRYQDVLLIQKLLDVRGFAVGELDGLCGNKMIRAIRKFQSNFLRKPDGRIDVDGRSWNELRGLS
jgi:hypothetical protein